jgi:DNA polymerase
VDASDFIPPRPTLTRLRAAAEDCRGCPLWQQATQTVFGEGPEDADAMLVGEIPGDREDRTGHPFVGPAGRELDLALESAGVDRASVYVTNAVKHFKFEERGKRRIHQKPARNEIDACGPWLDAEIKRIRPRGVLAMGATAAARLLGSKIRVTRDHGVPLPADFAELAMVTIHPSAILRARDKDGRQVMRDGFAADIAAFAEALGGVESRRGAFASGIQG